MIDPRAIIDPSAAIREEYTNYQVLTVDGQLLTGLLVNRTEQAIELRTAEGQNIRVLQDEIETLKASPISLMPEDQLSGLSEEAIRDLMNYITS